MSIKLTNEEIKLVKDTMWLLFDKYYDYCNKEQGKDLENATVALDKVIKLLVV